MFLYLSGNNKAVTLYEKKQNNIKFKACDSLQLCVA